MDTPDLIHSDMCLVAVLFICSASFDALDSILESREESK